MDIWQEQVRLRLAFADRIEALDTVAWNAASWCQGWRVRDVLAHLVQNAERTSTSLMVDLLRGGFRPDRAMSKAAKRLSNVPVPELADRLRTAADRPFHLVGSSEGMGLADVLVHSVDAFRPVGQDVDVLPAHTVPALDALWKTGRVRRPCGTSSRSSPRGDGHGLEQGGRTGGAGQGHRSRAAGRQSTPSDPASRGVGAGRALRGHGARPTARSNSRGEQRRPRDALPARA